MRVLALILLVAVAATCHAQGMPREAWSVESARSPGVRYLYGFETEVISKDDAVRWQAADGLISAPLSTNPKRSLFVSGSYRYIGLDNRRRSLPPRLLDVGLGAFGTFAIGDLKLSAFVNASMRSDGDRIEWDAFSINASLALRVPIDDEWSITPSVFISTGVRDSGGFSFRYIPLPGVSVAWQPSEEFEMEVGVRSASLKWRPLEWFTLQLGYTIPYGGSIRVTQQPVKWFAVSQFFGRYADRYVLTGERWPDDHLIRLESFGAGVSAEFLVPLGEGETAPRLSIGMTYGLGVGGKARIWNYVEDDELFELKTRPSHNVAFTVSLLFGRG